MIENIIRELNSQRHKQQSIDFEYFVLKIKKLQNENIYDIRIGIICEEFLCDNPIINYDIFKYLSMCYEKFNLSTSNTKKVISLICSYYGYNNQLNDFEETIVRYYLKNKDFGFEFYNNFIKIYKKYGPSADIMKKCVESIIRQEYYCNQEIINIFCEIYDETSDIKLLEEILWKSIKNNYILEDKYFEKMKEFYLNKKIFSKKAFEIIIFMVMKLGYLDIYKLVCNMLKYEIIKYSGKSKILYYKVSEHEEWKTVKYEGEYPLVKLGYSFQYYLMISENGKASVTKIQREYINQNLSMFLDFYNVIEDEEFKEFAALVCYEFNFYEEEILNYYLKHSTNISEKKKIYKFILSNLSNSLIGDYIIDYYKMTRNIEEIIGYIYKLSEADIKEAVKTLLSLDYIENSDSFIINSTKIIDKVLNVDELDLNLSKFLLKVFIKINNEQIKNKLRQQLIIKTYNSDLVPFLYDMYNASGDRRFAEKLISICKNTNVKYDDEIISFVIKHLEAKKQELKEFLFDREFDEISYKTLFNVAEKYFEKDKHFSIHILKFIENKYDDAKKVMASINDENTIIGKYIIGEKISTGNFAHIFRADNLFKKEKVWAVYIRKKFEKIFKNSIEKKSIGTFKKQYSGFYIIKSVVSLRQWIFREGVGKEKLLEYFIDILDMAILFMNNDVIFENISLDNILMLDEKPIPIFVYNLSKFNKSSISQNKDLVNRFRYILNDMLNSISNKEDFIIEEENCKDLKRFRDNIVLNLSKIKNSKFEKDVEDYENLINTILDQDIAVKEAYNNIMFFEIEVRNEDRINYLLRYFKVFKSEINAIKMLEIIRKKEQYILNNKQIIKAVIKFIKIICRNKYISYEDIGKYINSSNIFSTDQREYLNKFNQFMNAYKTKVVTDK